MSSQLLAHMSQVRRVAWYRFRATFGRRWGGASRGKVVVLRRGRVQSPTLRTLTGRPRLQGSLLVPYVLAAPCSHESGSPRRLVPVPGHVRSPLGRLSERGAADRVDRWDRHGVDGSGETHSVVVSDIPGEH